MKGAQSENGDWMTVEQAKEAGVESLPTYAPLTVFDPDVWRGQYFGPKDDGSVSGAAAMLRRHAASEEIE